MPFGLVPAGRSADDLMTAYLHGIRPAYLLLALFTTLLVAGLLLGGFNAVLSNARVICHDCIGLF
jgi:hypothetical protein